MGFVIEALPQIDNVLCAGFLQTFQVIADTATMIIPGAGQVATAARVAVNAAKTFAENDLGSEAFGNWIGNTCGLPEGDFKYFSIFDTLIGAPDSMGTSVGCVKKGKKGCKPLEPRPDPKSDPKLDEKPNPNKSVDKPNDKSVTKEQPQAPKSDEKPVDTAKSRTTKTNESLTTTLRQTVSRSESKSADISSTALACKLGKRASPSTREGKLGEDETHDECNKKDTTVHITKTSSARGWYTKLVPMTCSKQYSQACYHYR